MATFNRFNVLTRDLVQGKHQFGTHTFKVMLTNTAPVATNAIKSDITEIAAGNGYTAGGQDISAAVTLSTAQAIVSGTDKTFTASGGTIGPFRYAVVYNATQTTPNNPLVCWWDYGSSITLNSGESWVVDFNSDGSGGTNTVFTIP